MTYPDPGGIFASDAHRRVMANLPNPDEDPLPSAALLSGRIAQDDHLFVSEEELAEILADLEADGHAEQLEAGWKNTEDGFTALTGPIKEN